MTDLIDRQAAIDALAKFVPYVICDESTESYANGLTDAYNLICQLPSAQPERIRGRWGTTVASPILIVCNRCGRTVLKNGSVHWNFCPNCGAKMEVSE